VKVDEVTILEEQLEHSANLLRDQLGEDGLKKVGGRKWWQWRKPGSAMKAEWIEMRADYNERKKNGDPGKRVMLYVHGGAYFFGSVDEHRYQMQRHARKLKARVFAPRYRLAPQFPFPCGLQDCLAAYLYLLTVQDPSTIILAGDSAGGGMVLSMLCTLRDRGIPLPAGAILISPWCDLTHSFPSVSDDNPLDYIPSSGFMFKPSRAWPPPSEDDLAAIRMQVMTEKAEKRKSSFKRISSLITKDESPEIEMKNLSISRQSTQSSATKEEFKPVSISIDGVPTIIKDQIQVRAA
jgi:acetyl esterase/lipase